MPKAQVGAPAPAPPAPPTPQMQAPQQAPPMPMAAPMPPPPPVPQVPPMPQAPPQMAAPPPPLPPMPGTQQQMQPVAPALPPLGPQAPPQPTPFVPEPNGQAAVPVQAAQPAQPTFDPIAVAQAAHAAHHGDIEAMMAQQATAVGSLQELFGNLDLSQVSTANFRPLDPNLVYEFIVLKVEAKRTKDTHAPMQVITLRTVFPQHHSNVMVIDYMPITDKTLWRAKSFWEACELMDPTGARLIAQSLDEFKNCLVRAGIRLDNFVNEQGQTEKRNKINGGYQAAWECDQAKGAIAAAAGAPTAGAPVPNFG